METMPEVEAGLRLVCAAVLGGVLGLNRELRGKPAGLRTHALVCLASALLVLEAIERTPDPSLAPQVRADAVSRTVQGILTGIGFLGGGVILREPASRRIHGLTTAATIWLAAALGILCGAGLWAGAVVGLGLTLAILTLGRRAERWVHARCPGLAEEEELEVSRARRGEGVDGPGTCGD